MAKQSAMPSLTESFVSFLKPKPVFNRPVYTERHYKVQRMLYLVLLSLLLTLAATVIALKAMTIAFIDVNSNTGFMFETGDSEPTLLAALPRQLYMIPAKLTIIAAAISIFVAVGHIVFIIIDWKDGKRTQAYNFRRNTMYLHFANAVVVLHSLIAIFVTHKWTSHFNERYIQRKADLVNAMSNDTLTDGMRYNIGSFDLETWSCELKTVQGAMMVWEDYARQCSIELAGRSVLIPLMVVSFVLAGLGIAEMMRCRRDADGRRMKTEEVGIEMGKFNAI